MPTVQLVLNIRWLCLLLCSVQRLSGFTTEDLVPMTFTSSRDFIDSGPTPDKQMSLMPR